MLVKRLFNIRYVFLFSVLLFVMTEKQGHAQYFSTGQEAASIRWRQISTAHIKLVFPDYYEANARKLAAYIDTSSYYASKTLKHRPKRISLLLHTQSTTSNALVIWAPKRMEFYTTPPQDMYAQPWLEQLTLHEYRHVVQVDKLNQGMTKVISWIFGQQGTGAILGLYVPPWFLEGDAVATETGLSHAGRGRQPLFEMKLRAQFLEKGIYPYDKAVLGSYKDFIPNEYELGYFMVAEGRRKYGAELWSHTLDVVAKRPYMITPFQKGIKDISGKRKLPFYQECMDGIKQRWAIQDRLTEPILVRQLSPDSRNYTNYRHPKFIGDKKIMALRTGIDDIPRFVSIDTNGVEEVVYTPGFLKDETISCTSDKICWVETRPDPRWANKSSTVIRTCDIGSGESHTLNLRLRLFAPSLSDDASRILVVYVDSIDQHGFMIIDAKSDSVIKKIPVPRNVFPQTPVWAGGEHFLTVLVRDAGKSLVRINIEKGSIEYLTDWDYNDISQPVYYHPNIYFTAAWSGISNIYALNTDDGSINMISNSRFGAVDPVVSKDGKTLMYADYTADGYRIIAQEMGYYEKVALEHVFDRSIALHEVIAGQEEVVPAWSEMPESKAPSKKYSKIASLFNFHSWAPLDINASTYDINPGVSIMSQNLLSSSFLSAGYQYNMNEEEGKVYGSYSYHGWYPVIDVYADYGLRREVISHALQDEITWNETNIKAGLRLPLNLRRGKYYAGITPSVYLNQIIRKMRPGNILGFTHPNITSAQYSIRMYRQIKRSVRDIYPAWGQSFYLYYDDTPFDPPAYSYLFAGIASLYFPGIMRHHGLNIYGGYQHRHISNYKFSGRLPYPRGITGRQDEQLYSCRGTYAFPIAYPDWSLGPLIYLKRIRGAIFYDYALGINTGEDHEYNSMGVDLITEVHLLRFLAPFEFGLRSIYLPDDRSVAWNFLFGVGF